MVLAQAPATSATSSSATTLTAARTGSSARCSSSAPHCVEPTSSIRLSCARIEPFRRDRFCAPRRAQRETRARPKLGRIDFDATETERSRVWSGPPKPVVGTHTGYKAAAGAGAPGPRSRGSGGADDPRRAQVKHGGAFWLLRGNRERKRHLRPDFNVGVLDRCDTSSSAVLRELDESD